MVPTPKSSFRCPHRAAHLEPHLAAGLDIDPVGRTSLVTSSTSSRWNDRPTLFSAWTSRALVPTRPPPASTSPPWLIRCVSPIGLSITPITTTEDENGILLIMDGRRLETLRHVEMEGVLLGDDGRVIGVRVERIISASIVICPSGVVVLTTVMPSMNSFLCERFSMCTESNILAKKRSTNGALPSSVACERTPTGRRMVGLGVAVLVGVVEVGHHVRLEQGGAGEVVDDRIDDDAAAVVENVMFSCFSTWPAR